MGVIRERDCSQLGKAGHLARKSGLLAHGKSLYCSNQECDQINCALIDNPNFRTIYISSKKDEAISPVDAFYRKLQKHMEIVQSGQH